MSNIPPMYLRFVVRKQHPESRSDTGVFSVAYELLNSSELELHQRSQLTELLNWFSDNLTTPSRLQWSGQNRVICWFKPQAKAMLDRMWELVSILKDAGVPVELVKSSDPGVILYEDDLQVGAQPYRKNRKVPR